MIQLLVQPVSPVQFVQPVQRSVSVSSQAAPPATRTVVPRKRTTSRRTARPLSFLLCCFFMFDSCRISMVMQLYSIVVRVFHLFHLVPMFHAASVSDTSEAV